MSFRNEIKLDAIASLRRSDESANKVNSLGSIFKLFFTPEFRLVLAYRIYNRLYSHRSRFISVVGLIYYLRAKRKYSSDIHPRAKIGEGLRLGHHMNVIIGPDAIVGKNAYIFNGVTIGKKYVNTDSGMPVIGDNVLIGTGAKVLGEITVGSNSIIAANSVVLSSTAESSILYGAPAKEKERNET